MANSDAQPSMAAQEATRVSLQSQGLWDALKASLGESHAQALEQARAEAAAKLGALGPDSSPALRLAHSHYLLARATEISESLAAPAPHSPKVVP